MMSKQPDETTRGFRPSARRRNRIAAGVALGAAAIGGNVLVYSSLDDTTTAVQAVDNIPAGSQVTADMFRVVEVDVDPSVPTVTEEQLPLLIGQYSRVRIVSGSLVVGVTFQAEPLVEVGKAIIAIEIDEDLVPVGTRERSNVQLVTLDADDIPQTVPGRALAPPEPSASGQGTVSMSIEVDTAQAASLATAEIVRVVLLPPEPDTAAGDTSASPSSESASERESEGASGSSSGSSPDVTSEVISDEASDEASDVASDDDDGEG